MVRASIPLAGMFLVHRRLSGPFAGNGQTRDAEIQSRSIDEAAGGIASAWRKASLGELVWVKPAYALGNRESRSKRDGGFLAQGELAKRLLENPTNPSLAPLPAWRRRRVWMAGFVSVRKLG